MWTYKENESGTQISYEKVKYLYNYKINKGVDKSENVILNERGDIIYKS